MEVHDKIKQLRKEKGLSRSELYERLRKIFDHKAVTPNTIWRIESGLTSARASSLHQLCIGLEVSLKDLLGNTEPESKLVDMVKKSRRVDQYMHNSKAQTQLLTPPKRTFMAEELTLLPGGRTKTDENPIEVGKFEKWVYCLAGNVTCVVGTERHALGKGDCLSFESNIPHYFENTSSRKCRCIVVQNPRYI